MYGGIYATLRASIGGALFSRFPRVCWSLDRRREPPATVVSSVCSFFPSGTSRTTSLDIMDTAGEAQFIAWPSPTDEHAEPPVSPSGTDAAPPSPADAAAPAQPGIPFGNVILAYPAHAVTALGASGDPAGTILPLHFFLAEPAPGSPPPPPGMPNFWTSAAYLTRQSELGLPMALPLALVAPQPSGPAEASQPTTLPAVIGPSRMPYVMASTAGGFSGAAQIDAVPYSLVSAQQLLTIWHRDASSPESQASTLRYQTSENSPNLSASSPEIKAEQASPRAFGSKTGRGVGKPRKLSVASNEFDEAEYGGRSRRLSKRRLSSDDETAAARSPKWDESDASEADSELERSRKRKAPIRENACPECGRVFNTLGHLNRLVFFV